MAMGQKISVKPYAIDDNTNVLIQTTEIDAPEPSTDTGGDEFVGIEEELDLRLRQAIDRVRPAAAAVFDSLRELNSPKQIALEFGIGISGSFGAFIASTEANVSFKVKLTWENQGTDGT
jgi:hypothetical protein